MRVSRSGAAIDGTGTRPMWFPFPRICRTLRAMGGDLLKCAVLRGTLIPIRGRHPNFN